MFKTARSAPAARFIKLLVLSIMTWVWKDMRSIVQVWPGIYEVLCSTRQLQEGDGCVVQDKFTNEITQSV